jgi:hypothetical protein
MSRRGLISLYYPRLGLSAILVCLDRLILLARQDNRRRSCEKKHCRQTLFLCSLDGIVVCFQAMFRKSPAGVSGRLPRAAPGSATAQTSVDEVEDRVRQRKKSSLAIVSVASNGGMPCEEPFHARCAGLLRFLFSCHPLAADEVAGRVSRKMEIPEAMVFPKVCRYGCRNARGQHW